VPALWLTAAGTAPTAWPALRDRAQPTSCQGAQATGRLAGVGAVQEILPISACVLVSIAAVAACLVVWRDDHKRDRGT